MPRFAPLLLLLPLLAGCGGDKKKTPYPVRGRVLDAKRQPAAGVMVTLHPATPDATDPAKPTATTDEQGNFRLTTHAAGDGAPPGAYTITLVWPAAKKTPFEPPGPDRLNGQLAAADKSPHKFTVEAKPDQEVPTITLP